MEVGSEGCGQEREREIVTGKKIKERERGAEKVSRKKKKGKKKKRNPKPCGEDAGEERISKGKSERQEIRNRRRKKEEKSKRD